MASEQLNLDKHSMFIRTPVYRVGQDIVFGLRREVVPPDPSDVMIEVTQTNEDRLDLISYELYGTVDLWWAIAELNQIVDPMTEIRQGTSLRVPRRERLFNILST